MVAIGEASRLSGVSIETIRYYEREGIISKAGRTQSGRRAYSDAEISELRFIKRCRDLGFSIHDAVALRNLADAPSDACETVEQLGRKHLSDVRAKLHASVHNHFNQERSLPIRTSFKLNRAAAIAECRGLCAN